MSEQPGSAGQTEGHEDAISWMASEYLEHHKGANWYLMLGAIAAVIAVIVYFLADGDWFASGATVVVIITLATFASRRPDDKHYSIDDDGIMVDDKHYPFSAFSSFSIFFDGHYESLYMSPTERFQTPLNLYFPADRGEEIMDLVSHYVPYKEKDLAGVDRLMHRLRF